MALFARPVTDERDAFLTFLDQQRAALQAAVLGLTDEQARATPAASSLSLGGLIKHAARTERRWVVAGIAGEPLPGLWPIQDWDSDFQMDPSETLDGLATYYAETAALTERIVAGIADLGQAPAIREALDGQRAGELDDAYEAQLDSRDSG
jgi:hypothetical protein